MLLSRYSPTYIQQVSEKEATIRHYSSKIADANHKEDHEAADQYRGLMEKAIVEKQQFYRQYGEGKYTEEVMQMYDLLNKELDKENPDGTKVKTTFYAERGRLFDEIEQNERDRDSASSLESQARYQENIEALYVELGQLRSLYKEDGTPKEGLDLELAQIAKEYSEKKNKYGKFIITEKGQASFDREVERLEKSRKLGALTESQFQTRMSELVLTELTPEFFQLRKELGAEIDRLTEELA
jgi:hypothetical protein